MNKERFTLFLCSISLETDIREQKNYEIRTDIFVHNTVHDLRYEIKFENCVKDKNNFFINQNIAFLS